MLWSGKLFIVGVTVDNYAMVGVSVDSGYRRSENARSENTRGASPKPHIRTCSDKIMS